MRSLYFLLPGTGKRFACGGLWAELKAFELAKQICSAEVVTYRQREKDTLFLDDVLQQTDLSNIIFVMSWGFDVAKLAKRLKSHNAIYHAHSSGYGFTLPSSVPIITVSRNTLGYWGQLSPSSLIYYLPNQISDEFSVLDLDRDIDVLIHTRKSSEYLLDQLIPALQQRCKVEVINTYVDSLSILFNRTKVYLYDSAEYWAQQRVSEGFGLQPMEAMACGCQVFSSVNGGLSDYLDPGFNCHKIAGYSTEYDVQRILKAIANPVPPLPASFFDEYRSLNILHRLNVILQEVNEFFDHKQTYPATIAPLTRSRLAQLAIKRIVAKVQKKLDSR
ncbi:MAG: glycosyltransferase [Phormidium tanganyikae FI6-MK23]|jgi:glycosyltransferase involved in cell wall biosynthesis|nr:glycosyltransferase [Phormidium tanganyikae FI6-MK23]